MVNLIRLRPARRVGDVDAQRQMAYNNRQAFRRHYFNKQADRACCLSGKYRNIGAREKRDAEDQTAPHGRYQAASLPYCCGRCSRTA